MTKKANVNEILYYWKGNEDQIYFTTYRDFIIFYYR